MAAHRSPRASARGGFTANLEGAPIDDALRIPDTETMHYVYRLLREEDCSSAARPESTWPRPSSGKQLGPGIPL